MSTLPTLAAALTLTGLSALAPAQAAAPVIVAGIEAPRPGLDCADAADATRVHFHFSQHADPVRSYTVYLDGEAVDEDEIDDRWPQVTYTGGLHPGHNYLRIVADTARARVEQGIDVTVTDAPTRDGAYVPCGTATAYVEAPPTVIYRSEPRIIYEEAPVVEDYPAPGYYYAPPAASVQVYGSHGWRWYDGSHAGGYYDYHHHDGDHSWHGEEHHDGGGLWHGGDHDGDHHDGGSHGGSGGHDEHHGGDHGGSHPPVSGGHTGGMRAGSSFSGIASDAAREAQRRDHQK